jgi:hypothetical protein
VQAENIHAISDNEILIHDMIFEKTLAKTDYIVAIG